VKKITAAGGSDTSPTDAEFRRKKYVLLLAANACSQQLSSDEEYTRYLKRNVLISSNTFPLVSTYSVANLTMHKVNLKFQEYISFINRSVVRSSEYQDWSRGAGTIPPLRASFLLESARRPDG
jgi:hypothetical protein